MTRSTTRRTLKVKDIERLENTSAVVGIIPDLCTESVCSIKSGGMCVDTASACCCSQTCNAMSCGVW